MMRYGLRAGGRVRPPYPEPTLALPEYKDVEVTLISATRKYQKQWRHRRLRERPSKSGQGEEGRGRDARVPAAQRGLWGHRPNLLWAGEGASKRGGRVRGGADGGENRRPCPERPPSESCPFSEHFWLFCLNEEAFFFFLECRLY